MGQSVLGTMCQRHQHKEYLVTDLLFILCVPPYLGRLDMQKDTELSAGTLKSWMDVPQELRCLRGHAAA